MKIETLIFNRRKKGTHKTHTHRFTKTIQLDLRENVYEREVNSQQQWHYQWFGLGRSISTRSETFETVKHVETQTQSTSIYQRFMSLINDLQGFSLRIWLFHRFPLCITWEQRNNNQIFQHEQKSTELSSYLHIDFLLIFFLSVLLRNFCECVFWLIGVKCVFFLLSFLRHLNRDDNI